MSDSTVKIKELRQSLTVLRKRKKLLQEQGYKDYKSGKGLEKIRQSKQVSKQISLVNSAIKQLKAIDSIDHKYRKDIDAQTADFVFNTYKK